MNTSNPLITIIVGITGDLAKRKLLPALAYLAQVGELPSEFHIVGLTRQHDVTKERLLSMTEHAHSIDTHMTIVPMNFDELSSYEELTRVLDLIQTTFITPARTLMYLSVPPTVARSVIEGFDKAGMMDRAKGALMLEKPFGTDSQSAEELAAFVTAHTHDTPVYRVDHYVAKRLVQDLLSRPVTDRTLLHVAITAHESLGIEGRAAFYEETGALRDLVQSHLLQYAACTLAHHVNGSATSSDRASMLETLTVVPESVVRGQYEGYRDEVGNPDSMIETYASLTLASSDPHLASVPITIVTGKALASKYTSITCTYTDGSVEVFQDTPLRSAEAYERIFAHAINADTDMFLSIEEIRASWRIVTPILEKWRHTNDLIIYKQGSSTV